MAEKKLNIGNLVTPNGASMIFGTEASDNALNLKTEHSETWNPYTIVIDEEIDENVPANMVDYTPQEDGILTATDVQGAIDQLADSLGDVGGAFYAIYGETPYEEIVAAYEAGKSVFLIEEDGTYIYVINGYTNGTLFFNSCSAETVGSWIEAVQLDSRGWSKVKRTSHDIVTDKTIATTGQAGIVKLSTATNSTDTSKAATPSAVKAAYDLAASKGSGTITEVKANGTSVATSGVANIPAASTSAYGVTKLNSATNSTSETEAATPKAVKAAYDLAASKTNNAGTITGVSINGESVATSGVADIPAGTNAVWGVVKLLSSTSSSADSGSGVAATPKAVKSAYDLANAAMPKSGGTFTGAISYSGTTTISSSTAYYRPIRVSTSAPSSSDGNVGDIWIQYS